MNANEIRAISPTTRSFPRYEGQRLNPAIVSTIHNSSSISRNSVTLRPTTAIKAGTSITSNYGQYQSDSSLKRDETA